MSRCPPQASIALLWVLVGGACSSDHGPSSAGGGPTAQPTADSAEPVEVASPLFSAGYQRTCELIDGRLRVWGANLEAWQRAPRWIDSLPTQGIVEVSCQGHGGCLLTDDGSITCWDGEVGTQPEGVETHSVPGASHLAVGAGAVCVLANDELRCSIPPQDSRLSGAGVGDDVVVEEVVAPVALSLGPYAACAVDGAGQVICFGERTVVQAGQLNESVAPHVIEGLPAMVGVATGDSLACAWTDSGQGWCWGKQPGTTDYLPPHQVLSSGVTQMAVAATGNPPGSGYGWCALDAAGSVTCDTPSAASLPDVSARKLTELRSGTGHMCGRGIDGGLWCWGWDIEAAPNVVYPTWSDRPVRMQEE